MKATYRLRKDGFYSNVEPLNGGTEIQHDGDEFFSSFREAKKALVSHIRGYLDCYKQALKEAKNLNKKEVDNIYQ